MAEESPNSVKLAMLRVQLWTAIQQLKGEELAEFWAMIDELSAARADVFDRQEADLAHQGEPDELEHVIMCGHGEATEGDRQAVREFVRWLRANAKI